MRYLSLAIFAACLASSQVQAETNKTITFEGEVLDESCQALVNGANDAVVKLDPVKLGDFDNDSKTAGLRSFNMEITGCNNPDDNKKLAVKFIGEKVLNGRIENTADPEKAAKGVSVELTEKADGTNPIVLKDGTAVVEINGNEKFAKTGEATHTFGVRYYKESEISPGAVKAVVKYQFTYL